MTLTALKIRGPYQGPTGYDHQVREYTRAIAAAGVDVQLVDMPYWSPRRLPPEMRDPWFTSLRRPVAASVYLQFCMPHQVEPARQMAVANYTMFEASRVPPFWVKATKSSQLTIVPAESSYAIWLAAGIDEQRLRICPLGVDDTLFSPGAEPLPFLGPDGEDLTRRRTRVLNISEVVPRKNQKGLLRAWLLETNRSDDAVLLLKVGIGPHDSAQVLQPVTQALELEHGKRFADAAPVHIITDIYADAEMPRLYASTTHYLSMSLGEGWDLPMMEAAASGLHLIAPDHTAYRTYLTPETATLLPVREIAARAEGDTEVYFTGDAVWWEPDLDAARRAIRAAIDGNETTVASARDWILGNFTWRHAAARLIDILSELEQPR
ncbi:MAG: glycosyltransferase family 4 protein [Thermomicrobiales bacterium]|nr:glycosyltransferase family 4 protein [Thermomicrobiales bacterium]